MATQELQTITDSEIRQMREITGETTISMETMKVPYIHFNGQAGFPTSGKFSSIVGKDDKGKNALIEIGDTISAVILRVRKILQTGMDDKQELYTREFDSYQDKIDLYDRNQKGVKETGWYNVLKLKYNLKLNNILYIFYENAIYKLRVSGGSLNSLWTYLQSFGNNDTTLKYLTVFNSIDTKSDKGLPYKQMTITRGEPTPDWKMIWENLKMLDKSISKTAVKHSELLEAPKEDLPTIQVEETETIKTEDIPF